MLLDVLLTIYITNGAIGETTGGYFKMPDGSIIGKHNTPNGPTIDIKTPSGENKKIRFSHE